MKKEKQILMMSNSGDDSIFRKVKKGENVMIGSGEHATFIKAGEYDNFDKRADKLYKKINHEVAIRQIYDFFNVVLGIEKFKTRRALVAVRQIIIEEIKKDYYQNITNIAEVIDIDTHLMPHFLHGIDYMHVENLVIWQNGFYNFNSFNFPIPASVKMKEWSNVNEIVPKKLLRYQK